MTELERVEEIRGESEYEWNEAANAEVLNRTVLDTEMFDELCDIARKALEERDRLQNIEAAAKYLHHEEVNRMCGASIEDWVVLEHALFGIHNKSFEEWRASRVEEEKTENAALRRVRDIAKEIYEIQVMVSGFSPNTPWDALRTALDESEAGG